MIWRVGGGREGDREGWIGGCGLKSEDELSGGWREEHG